MDENDLLVSDASVPRTRAREMRALADAVTDLDEKLMALRWAHDYERRARLAETKIANVIETHRQHA
jgi:hypothetical protein